MTLVSKIGRTFDRIIDVSVFVAGFLLVFVTLSVTAEVLRRKLFGLSFSWVVEISEYSMLAMTLWGTAWVLRKEGHVKIELLTNRMSARNQIFLNIATSIPIIITLVIIQWFSIQTMLSYFKLDYFTPSPLRVPQWIVLAIIPVGIFLLTIQFLRRTWGFMQAALREKRK